MNAPGKLAWVLFGTECVLAAILLLLAALSIGQGKGSAAALYIAGSFLPGWWAVYIGRHSGILR